MIQPRQPGELRYPSIFSPLQIGNITVRNRLMQTAHAKGFASGDGLTNDRDIHYQAERAKGGIGLIVTGARHVHPQSTGPNRSLARGNRPEMIERDAEMVRAVHAFGGRIFAQLGEFVPRGRSGAVDDYRRLVEFATFGFPPHCEYAKEITQAEMHEVSEYFALTASNAKAAGIDGVEHRYCHG